MQCVHCVHAGMCAVCVLCACRCACSVCIVCMYVMSWRAVLYHLVPPCTAHRPSTCTPPVPPCTTPPPSDPALSPLLVPPCTARCPPPLSPRTARCSGRWTCRPACPAHPGATTCWRWRPLPPSACPCPTSKRTCPSLRWARVWVCQAGARLCAPGGRASRRLSCGGAQSGACRGRPPGFCTKVRRGLGFRGPRSGSAG